MKAVNKTSDERLTYTIPQAAEIIGINVITAYKLAKQKGFPSVRIGKRIVVPKAALERWLEQEAAKNA